jgi:hypothetical protein
MEQLFWILQTVRLNQSVDEQVHFLVREVVGCLFLRQKKENKDTIVFIRSIFYRFFKHLL